MIIGYSRTAPSTATDPDIASVKLLLGFEGANGDFGSPGMNDESPSARGTASGGSSEAKISTAYHKFGGSSLALSGSIGLITFPDSADFDLGSGHFTVEAFIRPSALSGVQFIVGQWLNPPNLGWQLYLNGTSLVWNVSTTGTDNLTEITGATVLTANVWHHVAIDYDGSKYRLYVDGVMDGSSSTPRTIHNSSLALGIGSNSGNSNFWFAGNMDELRITKGVARYASDGGLTVPTRAFPRS